MNKLHINDDTLSAIEPDTTALNALIDSGSLNVSKDQLIKILEKSNDILIKIAMAATEGHSKALDTLVDSGALYFSKNELMQILEKSPHTLNWIAKSAVSGHPNALNALVDSGALRFSKDELTQIRKDQPNTIDNIAHAAVLGHPKALIEVTSLSAANEKKLMQIFMVFSAKAMFPYVAKVFRDHESSPWAKKSYLMSYGLRLV